MDITNASGINVYMNCTKVGHNCDWKTARSLISAWVGKLYPPHAIRGWYIDHCGCVQVSLARDGAMIMVGKIISTSDE